MRAVLIGPVFMHLLQGNGIEKQFAVAAIFLRDQQVGRFQYRQVFHHADARKRKMAGHEIDVTAGVRADHCEDRAPRLAGWPWRETANRVRLRSWGNLTSNQTVT